MAKSGQMTCTFIKTAYLIKSDVDVRGNEMMIQVKVSPLPQRDHIIPPPRPALLCMPPARFSWRSHTMIRVLEVRISVEKRGKRKTLTNGIVCWKAHPTA
jgi:hypothetical protein